VSVLETATVGAAGFLAALAELGHQGHLDGEYVVFDYEIEVGSRAGDTVTVALAVPVDWPLTPPPGPHVRPRLGHPGGAVHGSARGSDFEYWSRPVPNWPADRSVRAYLRHLRTLFSQL
jgi:hypothetical protein